MKLEDTYLVARLIITRPSPCMTNQLERVVVGYTWAIFTTQRYASAAVFEKTCAATQKVMFLDFEKQRLEKVQL